jgi:hypothetical protein
MTHHHDRALAVRRHHFLDPIVPVEHEPVEEEVRALADETKRLEPVARVRSERRIDQLADLLRRGRLSHDAGDVAFDDGSPLRPSRCEAAQGFGGRVRQTFRQDARYRRRAHVRVIDELDEPTLVGGAFGTNHC